ncbi:MAG: carbohydrate binding family 9 domain-containing protein, partial [Chitinophagaceae bacterium]|nr:carbohydrate binding family 9 domain-containing protein [Chitinophagaceae bacterium]
MLRFIFYICLCLICTTVATSQPRNIRAIKVAQAPKIDGILEDVWKTAPVATDFITNTPVYGNPSTAKTDVRVLYDNTSIYIAAYIYDDPAKVRKQFTARDQEQRADVDYFSVFLDTYKDRQNAFQFSVTSRNVQSDARVSPQAETGFGVYGDVSWDAVWDSRVSFRTDGWIVEMKIPYFSIRFSKSNEQDWGIQFLRFSRRLNETSFWNPVDPNVNGFANQFGDLAGLQNLVPPLRLSFSPYISGGYRSTPVLMEPNKNEWLPSGGMDVKYGIDESFTLDATLIPDFGQVISDNVVNNISPFEVQFRENRPFFTEGTELFNKAGIFYSRRVGDVPERYF